jgi:hypothetical protein
MSASNALPRFDVWISPRVARWRNDFLLMTSFRVWDFCIDTFVAYRRWRDYALMIGWWRGRLFLVGSRVGLRPEEWTFRPFRACYHPKRQRQDRGRMPERSTPSLSPHWRAILPPVVAYSPGSEAHGFASRRHMLHASRSVTLLHAALPSMLTMRPKSKRELKK